MSRSPKFFFYSDFLIKYFSISKLLFVLLDIYKYYRKFRSLNPNLSYVMPNKIKVFRPQALTYSIIFCLLLYT